MSCLMGDEDDMSKEVEGFRGHKGEVDRYPAIDHDSFLISAIAYARAPPSFQALYFSVRRPLAHRPPPS